MAEQEKKTVGEGSDNYAGAARQGAKVVRNAIGHGVRSANTAVRTVKAGASIGKAATEIGVGASSGGLPGAIIAAAWSLRHTLFKILVCVCLGVLFIVVAVISIPDILMGNIENTYDASSGVPAVEASYADLASLVTASIHRGHEYALAEVERLIESGGYDRALTMAHLDDRSEDMQTEDICYLLSVYSVSAAQTEAGREHLIHRLGEAETQMYSVTYEVKEITRTVTVDGETVSETVPYMECIIHPFDKAHICRIFSLEPDAPYEGTGKSCSEMVDFYATAFQNLLGIT